MAYDIIKEIRQFTATSNAITLESGGNIKSVYERYIGTISGSAPQETAYLFVENNNATGNKARALISVKGLNNAWTVRGSDSNPVQRTLSDGFDFFYTAGSKITVYILKDLTDF